MNLEGVLSLSVFFAKANDNRVGDKTKRFKSKSNWVPENNDPMLNLFLRNLEFKLFSINESGRNYSNLSKNDRKALTD